MQTPTLFSGCGALLALLVMGDSSFSRALRLPECGTIVGSAESPRGRAVAGLHVRVHTGGVTDSAVTNRQGDFRVQVPGAGTLLVVASRDDGAEVVADSVLVGGLVPQRGYTMSLEVTDERTDDGTRAVSIARVTTRARSCAGPAR